KQADADLDRKYGAILSPMRSLESANFPGLDSLSDPLAKHCICTRVEVTRCHPDQFLTSVAQALAGLSVHVKNLSLIVAVYEQGIGRVIHKSAEAGLGCAQLFLGLLALRDVCHATHKLHYLAGTVQNRMCYNAEVLRYAAGKKDSIFHVIVRLFVHCSMHCCFPLVSILRMNTLQPFLPGPLILLWSEAINAVP